MNKEQVDQFYHLLRVASNLIDDEQAEMFKETGLTHAEQVSMFFGLTRHLLAGGDYLALVKYSAYYGQRFLIEPTWVAVEDQGWEFSRVVEFGAGLGWLGRGLAARSGVLPTLFVDKRVWSSTDVVADLETRKGRGQVLELLKPDDLIVMSDFLHCVDNPREVLEPFGKWPMAILEYFPVSEHYRASYAQQIERYGCRPLVSHEDFSVLTSRKTDIVELDPYILMLVEKEKA